MKNSPNVIGLYILITISIVSIFYFAKPIDPKTNYMKK